MKITYEQVLKDLESGKQDKIYYSSRTCWWTHDHKDLHEATKLAQQRRNENLERLLASNDLNDMQKKSMTRAKELADTNSSIPLDPTGAPLLIATDWRKFLAPAKENPEHYGAYGIEAFMLSHHKNCDRPGASWSYYNSMIELERQKGEQHGKK